MAARPALFVTCLVDCFRPEIGESAVRVLRKAGCRPSFDPAQTCCGQPAFNAGCADQARELARRFIALYEQAEAIVVPSGSCAAMIKVFYPQLLGDDPAWAARSRAVAARTWELSQYLVDVLERTDCQARFAEPVAYHESCHLSRMLGIRAQPRTLLAGVRDLAACPLERSDDCCGFGGSFAVKYEPISMQIAQVKIDAIERSGARVVTSCDAGCLMHIGGALHRRGSPIRALHLAEILDDQRSER